MAVKAPKGMWLLSRGLKEGAHHFWGKSVSGGGNSTCKGPEARTSLEGLRPIVGSIWPAWY